MKGSVPVGTDLFLLVGASPTPKGFFVAGLARDWKTCPWAIQSLATSATETLVLRSTNAGDQQLFNRLVVNIKGTFGFRCHLETGDRDP